MFVKADISRITVVGSWCENKLIVRTAQSHNRRYHSRDGSADNCDYTCVYFILSLTTLTTIWDKRSFCTNRRGYDGLFERRCLTPKASVLGCFGVLSVHTSYDLVTVSCCIIMKWTRNSTHNPNVFRCFFFRHVNACLCMCVCLFHMILMCTKISTTWFCYFVCKENSITFYFWRNINREK